MAASDTVREPNGTSDAEDITTARPRAGPLELFARRFADSVSCTSPRRKAWRDEPAPWSSCMGRSPKARQPQGEGLKQAGSLDPVRPSPVAEGSTKKKSDKVRSC